MLPAAVSSGAESPWMPLPSMFLHGSILHIMFNMIALWSLGTPMETTLGSHRFAWLYGVSGMGGALAVLLWHFVDPMPNPTVGASGAIFGLLGALAVFYPNSLMLFFFIPMKARTVVVVVLALSIVLMITDALPGLSHTGHIGGLIAGLCYARFALGLPVAGSTLHSQSRGPFGENVRPGGFPGAGPGRAPSSEEAARAAVNRFFRGESQEQEPGIFTGRGMNEKVVNPDPNTWDAPPAAASGSRPAPASSPAPDSPPTSPATPDSGSSTPTTPPPSAEPKPGVHPPSGDKRLHFDPRSGRFFFK